MIYLAVPLSIKYFVRKLVVGMGDICKNIFVIINLSNRSLTFVNYVFILQKIYVI